MSAGDSLASTTEQEHTQPPPTYTDTLDLPLLPASSLVLTVDDATENAVHREGQDSNRSISISAVVPATAETLPFSQMDTAGDGVADSQLLLGGISDDLPGPPHVPTSEPAAEEKSGHDGDADTDWDTAIQNKYSATSEWVESLPLNAAETPLEGDGAPASMPSTDGPTRKGKRAREAKGGQSDIGNGETQRQRRAREKAAEAELHTAFQHSQRALRKQAKSINMKDVFSRSITLTSPLPADSTATTAFPASPLFGDGVSGGRSNSNVSGSRTASTNAFSPLTSSFRFGAPLLSSAATAGGAMSPVTPSTSSAWSPGVVGELTNNFLANVKHQRRQKFEQFVSRELTQSQALSQTRSGGPHTYPMEGEDATQRPGEAVGHVAFSAPVDELVIGDEDNEAANWMPADASASAHARRAAPRDASENDDVVLLGGSSAGEDSRQTVSPSTVAADSRKAADAASQHQQQQLQQQEVVKSLARKHEIWKLKQRELKAQQQVDRDDRAKAMQLTASASSKSSATVSSIAVSSSSVSASYAETAKETGGRVAATSAASYDSLFRTSQISSPTSSTAATAARSLHKANLSADAISMIRRINSFDNTSTQRVVVFGTAAAAAAKQSKESGSQ